MLYGYPRNSLRVSGTYRGHPWEHVKKSRITGCNQSAIRCEDLLNTLGEISLATVSVLTAKEQMVVKFKFWLRRKRQMDLTSSWDNSSFRWRQYRNLSEAYVSQRLFKVKLTEAITGTWEKGKVTVDWVKCKLQVTVNEDNQGSSGDVHRTGRQSLEFYTHSRVGFRN